MTQCKAGTYPSVQPGCSNTKRLFPPNFCQSSRRHVPALSHFF